MFRTLMGRRSSFATETDIHTKLLLHCNGLDGYSNFVDSSRSAHVVTPYGDAQLDTSDKYFGTAAAKLGPNNDYLGIANSTDWEFGYDPFTIDLRVKYTALVGWDTASPLFTIGDYGWGFTIHQALFAMQYYWYQDYGFSNEIWMASPGVGNWTHMAMIRGWGDVSDAIAITMNGTAVKVIDATGWNFDFYKLSIGHRNSLVPVETLSGSVDEVRVSKGIARWTSNFTPPLLEYP